MKMRLRFFPNKLPSLALSAVLAVMMGTVNASVLFEQPPIDAGNAYFAETITPQQQADDFTLASAVSLESISWWGSYYLDDDQGDDFLVRLYSDIAGTGTILQDFGSVAFSKNSTTLTDLVGDVVYQYDFSLVTPLSLSAGTYYLSVQNTNNNSYWLWLTGSSGNGDLWSRGEDTDTWVNNASGEDLALRVTGTPVQQLSEPSSFALLGIAGLSLLLARRRRSQN